jgi:hypothetical protein
MTIALPGTPGAGVQEIRDVDRQILALLETRCTLARGRGEAVSGTTAPVPAPFYPAAFDVDEVLDTYRVRLGGPGELVARAVLNLCRATGAHETVSRETD